MSKLINPEESLHTFRDKGYDDWLRNKQIKETPKPKLKQLSKIAPKVKSGNVLSYSAAFVGTNMLFPGSFWQNAASSTAWEAARVGAKSAGMRGWKQWGVATGASVATNALWFAGAGMTGSNDVAAKEAINGMRFSGFDDVHNTIEGLSDSGLKQHVRHSLTEFGSGWDPMKSLAKQMFRNTDDSVRRLKASSSFREALASGKEIKQLGEGLYGSATLMETQIGGNTFQYVKKDINSSIAEKFAGFGDDLAPSIGRRQEALKSEYAALGKVSDRISPSPYMFDQKSSSLYMEYMPGKTLNSMENVPENIVNKIKAESVIAGQRGVFNPDIHRGNVLYDEVTNRVSWLDFGLAKTSNKPIESNQLGVMESAIADKISTPISIQPSVASVSQENDFFDDWGTVMSAKQSSYQSNQARAKRMAKFRQVSTDAVGIGHRAAHNAGRKHSGFSSTKPTNGV